MKLALAFSLLSIALPTFASNSHRQLRSHLPSNDIDLAERDESPELSTFEVRDDMMAELEERGDDIFGDEEQVQLQKRAVTCPTGYKYRILRDDFSVTGYNKTFWRKELGANKGLSWNKTAKVLRIAVTEDNDNTVFASKLSWLPGSTFTVVAQPAQVPGVVTPYIFKGGDASDEVDLEFVGGDKKSIQTVVWQKGSRVTYNLDSFQDLDTQAKFNVYKLTWGAQDVSLYVNNKFSRTMKRPGQAWALDALPMKWGPWAIAGSDGWAGRLDWNANPVAYVYTRAIRVQGCAKIQK